MNAKITIRTDKKNIQGLCPVVVQVYHKREVGRISLGFSLKPDEFNAEKEVVLKTNSNYKTYNQYIVDAKKKISLILSEVNALQHLTCELPLVTVFISRIFCSKDDMSFL